MHPGDRLLIVSVSSTTPLALLMTVLCLNATTPQFCVGVYWSGVKISNFKIPRKWALRENKPSFSLLRSRMLGPPKKVPGNRVKDYSIQSFCNVQEPNAARIHFTPCNYSFLGDISFVSHCFA
ncbi:unnamed protein product [Malus baccata var. baccata]